jgi:hypothetical protein
MLVITRSADAALNFSIFSALLANPIARIRTSLAATVSETCSPTKTVESLSTVTERMACLTRRGFGFIKFGSALGRPPRPRPWRSSKARATPDGYRLRFARHGVMRTSPERYVTRAEAERALWKMAGDGRADSTQDGRFRALVLLATFASLRWGEVSAPTRADLDLKVAPSGFGPRTWSGRRGRSCSGRPSPRRADASSASRPR